MLKGVKEKSIQAEILEYLLQTAGIEAIQDQYPKKAIELIEMSLQELTEQLEKWIIRIGEIKYLDKRLELPMIEVFLGARKDLNKSETPTEQTTRFLEEVRFKLNVRQMTDQPLELIEVQDLTAAEAPEIDNNNP